MKPRRATRVRSPRSPRVGVPTAMAGRALRPIAKAANGSALVCIEGPIGFPPDMGGINAAQLREQLRAANGKPLQVEFNSEGGVVTEGIAMYNALRAYKGKKVGIVTGLAASIASVALMACDEIRVAKGAFIMIHNPSVATHGEASELRAAAETLETMRAELLDIYEARTGCDRKKLEKMLDAETYMTAEEAVELGFADAVETFEARIALQAVARLNPEKVPAELRASAKGKAENMKPKMKKKLAEAQAAQEAAAAEVARLEALAAEGDDEEETDEEDEEEKPEDSEDEPHNEEDDEEEQASATAIVETVKALTGAKSGSVALGKLAALVSKGTLSAATNRAEQVAAAIKAGKLAPAMKSVALKWSDKAWSTYVASMGGERILKLGRKHTPPAKPLAASVESERELDKDGKPVPTEAERAVAKAMGKPVESIIGAPPCAPQLHVGGGKK